MTAFGLHRVVENELRAGCQETHDRGLLEERYVPVMSRENNVPNILASVNVGVFLGASLKWAIACDRISWETAVIAVPAEMNVPTISSIPCMNADRLASYIKSQYSWKPSTAEDFNKRFMANYKI
jgi:hypothetical protein